jgi:hypothetical protein
LSQAFPRTKRLATSLIAADGSHPHGGLVVIISGRKTGKNSLGIYLSAFTTLLPRSQRPQRQKRERGTGAIGLHSTVSKSLTSVTPGADQAISAASVRS